MHATTYFGFFKLEYKMYTRTHSDTRTHSKNLHHHATANLCGLSMFISNVHIYNAYIKK